MAVGLGETLASGNQKGSPYRMIYDPVTTSVTIKSYANYSYASNNNNLIDYSKVPYSTNQVKLIYMAKKLGRIAIEICGKYDGVP